MKLIGWMVALKKDGYVHFKGSEINPINFINPINPLNLPHLRIHNTILMFKPFFYAPFLASCLLLGITACDSNSNGPTDNFDRKAMLQQYATNLIHPAYIQLQNQAVVLEAATLTFNGNPTAQTLTDLRTIWVSACTDWQYANAYNFGPAGESGLRKGLVEEIGTFPASSTKIEDAITSGQWNLEDFNRDARGFLAIEYLIFGSGQSAAEIATAFANDAKRRDYLSAIVTHLKSRVAEVLSAWNSPYQQDFIENDGTDVGSSTSQLYNEFVRSYESIKNFKLGLPLGKRPGQTQSEPQLVEAFYSGQTLTMLKNHVTAIENIWYGRSKDGVDGIGFREYLESVEGGNALISSTETQLAALKAALAAVPESPSIAAQITSTPMPLEALYVEFSKTTRYFKSDLSSLLGIAITFSSGDGD